MTIMPAWEVISTVSDEGPLCSALSFPFCLDDPGLATAIPRKRPGSAPLRRGWDRQSARRQQEFELRRRSVVFHEHAHDSGWSTEETAVALGMSARTLSHWHHDWETGLLAPHPRGRPPSSAPPELRAEVTHFLEVEGPTVSLSTLRAEYADVARAELAEFRADYRAVWRAEHTVEQCQLDWLRPGSVWAMDFTHPPHLVDGVYPAILNVRDLGSHQQLFWLPVENETACTVIDALDDLFGAYGPPLVLKCDNGPAFIAAKTKGFLRDRNVFTLYSPPYRAPYNGACERANGTLKAFTEHIADRAGRPGFWTSDDLLAARLRANRLSRPWGVNGPTPEQSWAERRELQLDERNIMWQDLSSGIASIAGQRLIDSTAALPHYTQTEIERLAAQPVLEKLGLLRVTRRRIAPVI
jgi:transposase InsO family protein